jgi:ABC-2 type transport system ATP-binding protein
MESLSVNGLAKRFGDIVAVDDITLRVPKGSIFAFLGPNGAGKSTSIKIFTTLLKPDKGSVFVEGIDVSKQRNEARKQFAVVFQDQSIDEELTAYENMKFHAVLYDVPQQDQERRILDGLGMVGLLDRKDSLVKTFSGGMKRRLEIGRGLIHYPKILFLDEPTTGLDPQTREAIWNHIRMLNKERGMTIFLTTHYIEEAEEVSDLVAIIDHGRIVDKGTVAEIKRRNKSKTLEQAFLKLTGKDIREEKSDRFSRMRMFRRFAR